MTMPRFLDDPAFKALRVGELDQYHQAARQRERVDFSNTDLRGTDFRKVDLSNLIVRNAYLRDADFRGCDMRHMDLDGVSIHNAKISGAFFPKNVSAAEIRMSLRHGTRIRTSGP